MTFNILPYMLIRILQAFWIVIQQTIQMVECLLRILSVHEANEPTIPISIFFFLGSGPHYFDTCNRTIYSKHLAQHFFIHLLTRVSMFKVNDYNKLPRG
jgi:hypothetical protein